MRWMCAASMKVVQVGCEAWNTPMEHAIADKERRRYEAMKQADIAVLREVLDDLLVYAHSNAATDDKESYLAKVRAGYFR